MEPNARDPQPRDRDRDVRLSRRIRAGVVSVGVVGSLGVAGAVGYAAVTAAQDASAATGTSSGTTGSTFSFPSGDDQPQQGVSRGDDGEGGGFGDDGEGDDDGGQVAQQPGQLGGQTNPFGSGQAPGLQQGFGSPSHGSTSGS